MNREEFHKWLFSDKDGKVMRFSSHGMPFAVFKHGAEWGGSCEIGDVKCGIRILHNMDGEDGKRLEVWFPHKELGREVDFDEATLVGHMAIQGSFKEGNGKCVFRRLIDG